MAVKPGLWVFGSGDLHGKHVTLARVLRAAGALRRLNACH